MTCIETLLLIIPNVFLEPVFVPRLSMRYRNLRCWNTELRQIQRRRSTEVDCGILMCKAGAGELVGNVSGNISYIGCCGRVDGA